MDRNERRNMLGLNNSSQNGSSNESVFERRKRLGLVKISPTNTMPNIAATQPVINTPIPETQPSVNIPEELPWYKKVLNWMNKGVDPEKKKQMDRVINTPTDEYFNSEEYKQQVRDTGNISAGVFKGSTGLGEAARGIVNAIGGVATGNSKIIEEPSQWDVFNKVRSEEMAKKGFVENIPENLSQTITQMLPSIATGGTTGLVIAGGQAGGQNAQQALDEGATPLEALGYGTVTGVAEGALEKLGFIPGIDSAAIRGLTGSARKNAARIAADYLKKSAQEGLEEVAIEPISQVAKGLLYDDSVSFNPLKAETYGDNGIIPIKRMAESGTLGFLAGGLMGSASLPGQISQARTAQSEISTNMANDLYMAQGLPQYTNSYKISSEILSRAEHGILPTYEDYNLLSESIRTEVPRINNFEQQIPQQRPLVMSSMEPNKRFSIQNDNGLIRRPLEQQNNLELQSILPQQENPITTQATETNIVQPDNVNAKLVDAAKKYVARKMQGGKTYNFKDSSANDINVTPKLDQSPEVGKMVQDINKISNDKSNDIKTSDNPNKSPDIDDRGYNSVGEKKIKSYQYENPEVKPWYQNYAKYILKDEFIPAKQGWNGDLERSMQGDVYKKLRSAIGSNEEIRKGLEAIINDKGAENIAAAKRVELVIDDMLSNGFRTKEGAFADPAQDYISLKESLKQTKQQAAPTIENKSTDNNNKKPVTDNKNSIADNKKPKKDSVKKQYAEGTKVVSPRGAKYTIVGKDGDGYKIKSEDGKRTMTITKNVLDRYTLDKTESINNNQEEIKQAQSNDVQKDNVENKVENKVENNKDYDKLKANNAKETDKESDKKGQNQTIEDKQENQTEEKPKKENKALPDNIKDIKKYIEETQSSINKGVKLLDIDLQLFAEAKRILKAYEAVSKFYSNTIDNANFLTDEQKELFKQEDYIYNRRNEEESLEQAAYRLAKDFEGEVELLKNKDAWTGIDFDVSMGILESYKQEGANSGDYGKMLGWSKVIRKNGSTEAGRTVQAHAKYSRTPEDTLLQAEKVIEQVEDDIKTKRPEEIKRIEQETDVVEEIVDKAEKQAEKEVGDEIAKDEDVVSGKKDKEDKKTTSKNRTSENNKPKKNKDMQKDQEEREETAAEMLARRITAKTNQFGNPKTATEKDVINRMVDELYAKYKETIPEDDTVKPDTKYEEIAFAVENRVISGDVWTQAKNIVRENFKDNPEALDILDDYFGKGTRPPFSEKLLNSVVIDAMEKLDVKLSDMVKEYYRIGEKQRGKLVDYIVNASNLTGDDARVLAQYVQDKFKQMKKEYSEKYLESLFKPKSDRTVDDLKTLKDIEALSNTGAFDNVRFANQVFSKIDPKIRTLIRKSGIRMSSIVKSGIKGTKFNEELFIANIMGKIEINDTDARVVASYAEEVFNNMANESRDSILKNIFRETNPKKKRKIQDKILELINLGAYDRESIRNIMKEKENIPLLSNEDIKTILELAEISQNMDKESYMYELSQSAINKIMSNKVPVKLWDKIIGLRRLSLLSAPVTHIRNVTSNIFFNSPLVGLENLKDYTAGALIDAITSKALKSERTTLFDPLNKSVNQFQGGIAGLNRFYNDFKVSRMSAEKLVTFFRKQGLTNNDAKKMAEIFGAKGVKQKLLGKFENLDTSKSNLNYELQGNRVFKNETLNAIDTIIKTGLRIGDVPFFESAKVMRISELKKIRGTDVTTEEIILEAELFALERVFQNNSDMVQRLQKIKSALSLIGDIYIPFTQTPSNIFDKLIDYTPLGTAKALYELGKEGDRIVGKRLVEGKFNQKLFVDRLARSFTGTGLLLFFMMIADLDLITAGDDEKERVRENEKAMGFQRYSLRLKIGDKTYMYSFENFAPVSALMGMAAEAVKSYKKEKNTTKAILSGFEAAGEVMINSSMLKGLLEFTTNFNVFGTLGKSLNNAVSQTNPSIMKRLSATLDPWARETYDPDMWKQGLNRFIANVPIVSRTLPQKYDVYGKPVERYGGFTGIFNTMFNPGTMKEYKPTKAQKEIYDVYMATDDPTVFPGVASESITIKGAKIILNTEEYIKLQRLTGEYTEKGVEKIIDNDNYKKLKPNQKADVLSKIIRKSADVAKEQMLLKEIGKDRIIEELKRKNQEESNN